VRPKDHGEELALWTVEQPKRYLVEIAMGSDRVREEIGFRAITTRGADILLNGESIFLRGISIHEQAPERPGRATSEADARKLLGWAKELGCNFVRLAHYPHNEHMVRVAEELGLLVWSEVPVYWTIQWENPETYANAERQITEMVMRDKNRAAVILWSVSNETPISEPRNAFLRKLIATVRGLDPTRLLTAALERHYDGERTQVVDDPLGADLDVLGVNEYVGWYDGLPAKCDTLEWKVVYEKPLVFSELGGDAKAGHYGPPEQRWTEEFQADLYEHQLAMLKRIRTWRGLSPWILTDFQSPRRPLPKIQDGWNRKGLVSDHGDKKQAFFVLQAFYEAVARDPKASRA
jgi:beta-glucuronidase